ncbi:MAG: N-methyl-L-tryptophan oxidase [Chloroflexota bacterium]
MPAYDAIVMGLGAMGSAALYHLARRGARVVGFDAHARRHALGSSHGTSRIIREAYYEAPEYVPLLQRAYGLWRELEQETGRSLLQITGGLNLGAPDSEFVTGALASARQHGLDHEYLAAGEINARFSAYSVPDSLVAVYEPNAGVLKPEECVVAHLDAAIEHGAQAVHETPVKRWHRYGAAYRVETANAVFTADRLVIAGGPWSADLLADLGLPLEVWRIPNVHFEPDGHERFAAGVCPVYLWQVPEGDYYGFPWYPGEGVKFGRHDLGEICTPATIRRGISEDEIGALRAVLNQYMPGAGGDARDTLTCMYTVTPDRHFVLDRHAAHRDVVYGAGFSGHGFKFATVIGEVLAQLALDGGSAHDIRFLSAARFATA